MACLLNCSKGHHTHAWGVCVHMYVCMYISSLYHKPSAHRTVRGHQFVNLCLDLCLPFGAFRQVVVVLDHKALKMPPTHVHQLEEEEEVLTTHT